MATAPNCIVSTDTGPLLVALERLESIASVRPDLVDTIRALIARPEQLVSLEVEDTQLSTLPFDVRVCLRPSERLQQFLSDYG